MTTTSTKTIRAPETKAHENSRPATRTETRGARLQRIGKEVGTLTVNVYERGVADIVAFEKDAAKITRHPWAKNALTMSAGLIEDVGAAYIKTARQALR